MGGRGTSGRATQQARSPGTRQQLHSDDASLPLATRVATAIREIKSARGLDPEDFVKISDVADKLHDISTDALRRTLTHMSQGERSVTLHPQSNQKILTERQHDTAVREGNQAKHLINFTLRGRDTHLRRT